MAMTENEWRVEDRDSEQFEQQSGCKQLPSSLPTRETY